MSAARPGAALPILPWQCCLGSRSGHRATSLRHNPSRPGAKQLLTNVLVDIGAELTWVPADVLESLGIERYAPWRFRQAGGAVLESWSGAALVHVAGERAADEVVFGDLGDPVLLRARSLEGLNLRVEPANKRLVDAGPAQAATIA
jgi:predicted aspartyl protease